MRIIQITAGLAGGDGVSNVVKTFDRMLKDNGYTTTIISEALDENIIQDIETLDEAIVFYHVAFSVDPMIIGLRCRKVMVFHNITFPVFFEEFDEKMRMGSIQGWYDISQVSQYFESVITFSEFSKRCLVKNGWDEGRIGVVPIMVRFDKLKGEPNRELIEKYSGNGINLLFTGRICPNKKQEDIIRAFAEYKAKYSQNARLFLVGSVATEKYDLYMRELISKLNLKDSVILSGYVSFPDYLAYYDLADIYICMSEHEGFCIPLVEAMYFQKPVIAYNGSAVGETMCGSGILVDTKCPAVIAREINLLVSDRDKRDVIIAGQDKRLKELMPDMLMPVYEKIVFDIVTKEQVEIRYRKQRDVHTKRRSVYSEKLKPQTGQKVIICGAGRIGRMMYKEIKKEIPEFDLIICDSSPAKFDKDVEVESLRDAAREHNDSLFVISVQNKTYAKEILGIIIDEGIRPKQVFYYDNFMKELY